MKIPTLQSNEVEHHTFEEKCEAFLLTLFSPPPRDLPCTQNIVETPIPQKPQPPLDHPNVKQIQADQVYFTRPQRPARPTSKDSKGYNYTSTPTPLQNFDP